MYVVWLTYIFNASLNTLAVHTKYVGKSAGHENDVKFSEDGESVIEGEDLPE